GINCGETCAAPFAEGTKVVLSAVSGPNSTAVQWAGCDEVNLEEKCMVTISAAKTVTATFDLVKRKLTVEKKGSGTATVTSAPSGINCGATCSASYTFGTAITLTAALGPKTLKPSWVGCDSVDAEGKCLVTMSAAKTVIATLEPSEYELKVGKTGTGGGKVTSSPAGVDCGSTCSV